MNHLAQNKFVQLMKIIDEKVTRLKEMLGKIPSKVEEMSVSVGRAPEPLEMIPLPSKAPEVEPPDSLEEENSTPESVNPPEERYPAYRHHSRDHSVGAPVRYFPPEREYGGVFGRRGYRSRPIHSE